MNNYRHKVAEVTMANQVPVYDDDITGQESLGQVTSKIVHNLETSRLDVFARRSHHMRHLMNNCRHKVAEVTMANQVPV